MYKKSILDRLSQIDKNKLSWKSYYSVLQCLNKEVINMGTTATLRLDETEKAIIQNYASSKGMTMSEFMKKSSPWIY